MRRSREALLAATFAMVVLGCNGGDSHVATTAHDVQYLLVTADTVTVSLALSTTLRPVREAYLQFTQQGAIASIERHEGDRVRAGTVIMTQRAEAYTTQVASAQATLDKARLDIARVDSLYARQTISRDDWERAHTGLKAAEAGNALAQVYHQGSQIVAPFDGLVAQLTGKVGEVVTPGIPGTSPPVWFVDDRAFLLTLTVPESELGRLHDGARVDVTAIARPEQSFEAHVTRVGAYIDPITHTASAEARLEQPVEGAPLLAGMTVRAEVRVLEGARRLTLAERAILREAGHAYVFGVRQSHAMRREVMMGAAWRDRWIVDAGLVEGDTVLVTGLSTLRDGYALRLSAWR